jgi:TonB family protein
VDHPDDVMFNFERRGRRLGGALGISFFGQILTAALFMLLVSLTPKSALTPLLPDFRNYDLVWLDQPGPGGGGGGGGNLRPEPPRKAELPGKEKLAVPVAKPPEPKPAKDEPPPIEQVNIPAMTMAQGLQTLPGVVETVAPPIPDSQGSGTSGGAGTGKGTGIGPGEGSGLGPGSGGGTGGGVYRPGSGVTVPRPVREVKPQYTSEAMRAKIQGEVWLEAVVLPDGTVGSVEVVRSLDSVFGLDQEAIKAARQWRFVPGMRFGQAVPVLVTISMTFTLR